VSEDVTATTLIDIAQARLNDADFHGALDSARRAVAAAADSGDLRLEARALMTLAGALKPTSGEFCNECLAKEGAGTCR
jgi:hypothetical protein